MCYNTGMNEQTVWVVMSGERYEGSRIQAVFSSRAKARAYLKGFDPTSGRARLDCFEEEATDYWTSGCDILKIQKWKVQ